MSGASAILTAKTRNGWTISISSGVLAHAAADLLCHWDLMPVVGMAHPRSVMRVTRDDLDDDGSVLHNGVRHQIVSPVGACCTCGEDRPSCECECPACQGDRRSCGCEDEFDVSDAFSDVSENDRTIVDHDGFVAEMAEAAMMAIVDPSSATFDMLGDAIDDDADAAPILPREPLDIVAAIGINPAVLGALCLLGVETVGATRGGQDVHLSLLVEAGTVLSTITCEDGWTLEIDGPEEMRLHLAQDVPETAATLALGMPLRAVAQCRGLERLDLVVQGVERRDDHGATLLVRSAHPGVTIREWRTSCGEDDMDGRKAA
jgi:hypothetical protein